MNKVFQSVTVSLDCASRRRGASAWIHYRSGCFYCFAPTRWNCRRGACQLYARQIIYPAKWDV